MNVNSFSCVSDVIVYCGDPDFVQENCCNQENSSTEKDFEDPSDAAKFGGCFQTNPFEVKNKDVYLSIENIFGEKCSSSPDNSASSSLLKKRNLDHLVYPPAKKTKDDFSNPIKIRLLSEGELHIHKTVKIGEGKFKKVNFAQLSKDGQVYDVVFAKFINIMGAKSNKPERYMLREQYMLKKISEAYPNGCRGLMRCWAICQWKKGTAEKTGFVFPYYNGQTLKQAYSMSKKESLKVALDIAYGLRALHGIDILHNDLKPDNICLERDLVTNEIMGARIIDLGLASDLKESTQSAPIFTTFDYGSPELIEKIYNSFKCSIDQSSDIYSFGKILSEILMNPKDSIANLITDSQIPEPDQRPLLSEFIEVLEKLNEKYTIRTP